MKPNPRTLKYSRLDHQYLWHPFTQMKEWIDRIPVIIESGKGVYLRDTEGKRYLDGTSSIWVNIHGHRHPEINRSIKHQIDRIAHSTFLGLSHVPAIRLAEKLVKLAPRGLTKVFYSDNGSTAMEVAVKMAVQFWQYQGKAARKKQQFLTLTNAYHGDTVGTMSLGGIPLFHDAFKSLFYKTIRIEAPYCYRCPLGLTYPECGIACLEKLEMNLKNHSERIAGIVMEPAIMAAGGMIPIPGGYLGRIRELATRHDVLLILDEVATGFGRTGRMFASQHEKVTPDLMAVAKGLTGGYLPMAATLTTERIFNAFLGRYDEFKTFFHGHSFTGNPVAAAAGLANLRIFKNERTLINVRTKIKMMKKLLEPMQELPMVGDVRQVGLIGILELVQDKIRKTPFPLAQRRGIRVCEEAGNRGLLIRPLGNILVLMPPLSVSDKELIRMVSILKKSILSVDWK